MKYMLLMQAPPAVWDDLAQWTPEETRAMVDFMHALNKDLEESGEWVDGQGLTQEITTVTASGGENGGPVVTDGPFPESKEVLVGYWLVDVADKERAVQIALRASACPGRGGEPANQPIEVRPVGEAPEV
ncbi:YciI family protein [Streptomyces sp. YIM 98790]|uniref:YciI family protein n=1 Tax=Streptomyces sp. YIM 98790 TaxID=2689077 RepID=UPI0014085620|nr:YciI family protein [Streptomyces sp. YIM 98790]